MLITIPRSLTVSLGLFSGSSLSACWISVNPRDFIGAICVGTAACAIILLLLRFEAVPPRRNRRRGDNDGEAASA